MYIGNTPFQGLVGGSNILDASIEGVDLSTSAIAARLGYTPVDPANASLIDTGFFIVDGVDATKKATFDGSSITTATTRTYTLPDASGTVALLSGTQTFTSATTFSTATGTLNLGTSATTGVLTVGGTGGTGILTFGRSTGTQTTNIQAGATASGSTKTINFGTGGLAGSTTAINIGSATGTVTTYIGGNVGIGTSGPSSLLQVLGTTNSGYATSNAITSGGSAISNANALWSGSSLRLTANFGGAVNFTGRASELVFGADNGNFGSGGGFAQGNLGAITAISENGNATTLASSMLFYTTAGNAISERMRIDSAGNVGIGTATPVTLKTKKTLQVLGFAKLGDDNGNGLLSLGDIASTGANVAIWRGAGGAYAGVGNYLNLGGYDGITFTTGNNSIDSQTERARFDSSGRFLLGIASSTGANVKLVVGNGLASSNAVAVINNYNTNIPALSISNWDGSTTSYGPRIAFDNSGRGGFTIGGSDGANNFDIARTWGTPDLRIDSNGYVGINRTSVRTEFDVTGRARFNSYLAIGRGPNNNDGLFWNITPNTSGTAYTPGYIGSTGAGSAYLGMPSGGNGGLMLKVKRHGTTATDYAESSMTLATYWDDSGNVGIGTTPNAALHILRSSGNATQYIENSSTSGYSLLQLKNSGTDGRGFEIGVGGSTATSPYNGNLYFYDLTANTPRMLIDSSGNVAINTTSVYNSAKLSVNGKISAGDSSATSGSVLLESQYGAGTLGLFGTEYSSGGAVMAYGMRPATTASAAFKNAYGGGGSLTYSAITVADGIRFYTNTGQTLTLNADVTISERMRLTTAGALVLGHNAGWGYTTDVGSLVLSNGGADTPNVMFLTGTNKNWGIDSWNSAGTGGPQSSQYLRLVKDINETGGSMAVTISPIGNIGLGGAYDNTGVGIKFPASQAASSDANTLDDYEEGTWTPAWGSSGTTPTVAYSVQDGRYIKIGRVVHFWARIYMSTWGSNGTGTIRLTGLPFTSQNIGGDSVDSALCHVTYTRSNSGNTTWPTGATQILGRIPGASNYIDYISLGGSTNGLGDGGGVAWASAPELYNNFVTGSYLTTS